MNMKRLLRVFIMMMCAMKLQAQQLSIEEAKANILGTNFNQAHKIRKAIRGGSNSLKHIYTASSKASNLFYAFNVGDNQGFVIASADKRATPIIGFSEIGNFDIDSIPCNMYELLAGYEREIAWAIENNIQYEINSVSTYNNVNPLISSKWNQYIPYNDQCPIFSGNTRCVTGCTATATAQIMYYYKYPTKGIGSHMYSDEIKGKTVTLAADFKNTSYEWNKMQPIYANNNSNEAKKAVAQLMAHLGVALEMDYGMNGINASGASLQDISNALINYFSYDNGLYLMRKEDYNMKSSIWEEFLYNELKNKRPILYSGSDILRDTGHAFIIDGYKDGMFHMNFGWGGYYDGYFALSAICPTNDCNYSYEHEMIVGIQKPLSTDMAKPELKLSGNLTVPIPMYNRKAYNSPDFLEINVDNSNGFFYNIGSGNSELYLAVKLTEKGTGKETYISAYKSPNTASHEFPIKLYESLYSIYIPTKKLTSNGEYALQPVYKYMINGKKSKWETFSTWPGKNDSANLTISDFTYLLATDASNIDIPQPIITSYPKVIHRDESFDCLLSISNKGKKVSSRKYSLCLIDAKTGEIIRNNITSSASYNIQSGKTINITIPAIFSPEPGDYNICVIIDDRFVIPSTLKVEIRDGETEEPICESPIVLIDFPFIYDNQSNTLIDGESYKFIIPIHTVANYNGEIVAIIKNKNNDDTFNSVCPIQTEAGQTKQIELTGVWEYGEGNFSISFYIRDNERGTLIPLIPIVQNALKLTVADSFTERLIAKEVVISSARRNFVQFSIHLMNPMKEEHNLSDLKAIIYDSGGNKLSGDYNIKGIIKAGESEMFSGYVSFPDNNLLEYDTMYNLIIEPDSKNLLIGPDSLCQIKFQVERHSPIYLTAIPFVREQIRDQEPYEIVFPIKKVEDSWFMLLAVINNIETGENVDDLWLNYKDTENEEIIYKNNCWAYGPGSYEVHLCYQGRETWWEPILPLELNALYFSVSEPDEIHAPQKNASFTVKNGYIHISSEETGQRICLHNLNGTCLYSARHQADLLIDYKQFTPGIYILTIDNQKFKIHLSH